MATVSDKIAPKVQLIDSDGEPLETPWHFAAIALLIDTTRYRLQPRTNFFVGGKLAASVKPPGPASAIGGKCKCPKHLLR